MQTAGFVSCRKIGPSNSINRAKFHCEFAGYGHIRKYVRHTKTYVRWNGREQKLLFVSSNLSVESQGKKELEVKDLFVLEKKHGTWQVSWHGVGK